MAIKSLEDKTIKIVKVISVDATIKSRNPGPTTQQRIRSFIGNKYKIKTASDSLRKCIIQNEVICYDDLIFASADPIKGGTFDPVNLVR